MRILSDKEIGYLAGLIDGEGCFSYAPQSMNKKRFAPKLDIVMADKEIIHWLAKDIFQVAYHKQCHRKNRSDTFHITICANNLRDLLPGIVDILHVKETNARLMLKWLTLFPRNEAGQLKYAFKRYAIQEIFWRYNRRLNERGVGKRSEFRETLPKETILSQALQEIEEKAQRLEAEAKLVGMWMGLDIVKDKGPLMRHKVDWILGKLHRDAFFNNVNFLVNMGLLRITKVMSNNKKYATVYEYAGNVSTSAAGIA